MIADAKINPPMMASAYRALLGRARQIGAVMQRLPDHGFSAVCSMYRPKPLPAAQYQEA
jgi:hypothetical protein